MTDFELKDFERDIIAASARLPVLVDFWASWCGPCKMLGPVLEEVAVSANGRWQLVKVNTEAHPEIARRYAIRSIPNVKLFHHGRVIDEFMGFMPAAQLTAWIASALPSPHAQAVEEAHTLLGAGKAKDAAVLLEPVVAAEPANLRAKVFLAEALFAEQPRRTTELLAEIHEDSDYFIQATALRELAALCAKPTDTLPEGLGQAGFIAALQALAARDYAAAMEAVIASLEQNGRYGDGAAARLGRAIIRLLGIRHPVIDRCHRRFSSLVHA